jgi:transcriptional regulator of acetoin/glycerol metabolism
LANRWEASPKRRRHLVGYDWPGNVRQLKNFLEARFISASGRIGLQDFLPSFKERLQKSASDFQDEWNRLLKALFSTNWNKTKAAQHVYGNTKGDPLSQNGKI